MADTFAIVTNFINSPPGQIAAGGVLDGIVLKFFKYVGDALNEKTNSEIARWLRVKHFETGIVAEEAVNWPGTFAKVFDRVFGMKHLSWKCFWRSVLASVAVTVIAILLSPVKHSANPSKEFSNLTVVANVLLRFVLDNLLPDCLSLLKTRKILKAMYKANQSSTWIGLLVGDLVVFGAPVT